MPIRQAAEIHRLRHDPLPPTAVASPVEYQRAQREFLQAQIPPQPVLVATTMPPVYVEGWKWCIVCEASDCDNRPAYGWGIACCFECGRVYEGLTLPDEADEIERILSLRPKLSQRSWLPTETTADLQAQNETLGVGV